MLGPITLLLSALTFSIYTGASSVELEERGSNKIIGYRVTNEDQVKKYKAAGNTLTYKNTGNTAQIGLGVYTSPDIGQWSWSDEDWFCAILADEDAWNNLNKAWVPKSYKGCIRLWDASSSVINTYLKTLDPKFTTSNTVLLSYIFNFEHLQQAMIPPQLLGKSAGLGITVQCAAKSDTAGVNSLRAYGSVNYDSWNAKGNKDQQSLSGGPS